MTKKQRPKSAAIATSSKPLILVLDIDGTMIGDAIFNVIHYRLMEAITGLDQNIADVNERIDKSLKTGLLRPGFVKFIRWINEFEAYKNGLEIFVYTACEEKWAAVIVQNIENVLGFQFNRPIFARKDCILAKNMYVKSFEKIAIPIFAKLKNKYSLKSKADVLQCMYMIDNTDCIIDASIGNVFICPTYDVASVFDILENCDKSKVIENYMMIYQFLRMFHWFQAATSTHPSNHNDFLLMYESHLETLNRNFRVVPTKFDFGKDMLYWIQLKNTFSTLAISFDEHHRL